MYYTLDYIFRTLGAFFTIIAIPLLIAVVARLAKKRFWPVLWKSLVFISIPLSLLSAYGEYSEYNESKEIPTEISPSKYNPSNKEIKNFQSKVNSQSFLKLEQINQAIKKSPTNSINFYNRGIIYTSELNHNMAIKDYSKAIELDPNFSAAYLNRSAEYLFLNNIDNAFSDCSKAIQLNPNFSEAYFNRAKIRIHMGQTEESLEDMKKAAKLGNSDAINVLKKNKIDWNINNNNDRIKLLSKWSYLDKTTAELDKEYHYYMLQDKKSPVLRRTANEMKALLGNPDFEGHVVYEKDLQCDNAWKVPSKGYIMVYLGSIESKTPNLILQFVLLSANEPQFTEYIIEDAKSNNEKSRLNCIQR